MIWIGLALAVFAGANWQTGDEWQSGFCAGASVILIGTFIRDRFFAMTNGDRSDG